MPLELRKYPRQVFVRNPLKVVVMQLRFPPIFALEQPAGAAVFQEAIRERYPIAEARSAQFSISVGPAGIGPAVGGTGPWRFFSEDQAWVASIAPESVSLETTSYTRWEDFREHADFLLAAATDALRLTRKQRLGLRFVNEISHPDADRLSDWRQFLDPTLLGVAGGDALGDYVTQALEQIQVEIDDGRLTIRHGYHRDEESRSSYTLDFDAYDEDAEGLNQSAVLLRLDEFKSWIWDLFRGSITEELVEYLEPEPIDG